MTKEKSSEIFEDRIEKNCHIFCISEWMFSETKFVI